MSGTNDGSEIMRIFHAVKYDKQLSMIDDRIELGVSASGTEAKNALMRDALRGPIESFARLKAHGHGGCAGEFDDFLDTRAAGAFRDQDFINGMLGAEGFTNWVNTGQYS